MTPDKQIDRSTRRPGVRRLCRLQEVVNYLLAQKHPYFVRAVDLHHWIRERFNVGPSVSRGVGEDLRRFGSAVVLYSQLPDGSNRYYWARTYDDQIPERITRLWR